MAPSLPATFKYGVSGEEGSVSVPQRSNSEEDGEAVEGLLDGLGFVSKFSIAFARTCLGFGGGANWISIGE